MRRLMVLSVMIVAACSPGEAPPEVSAAAIPVLAPSARWQDLGERLALADEAGVLGLAIDCPAGGQAVELAAPTTVETAGPITLTAGASSQVFPTWIDSAGETGLLARAEVTLSEPVLTAFEATSEIARDGAAMVAGSDEEQAAIKGFFDRCRARGKAG